MSTLDTFNTFQWPHFVKQFGSIHQKDHLYLLSLNQKV
uniref:Uncharacterized protein n=1 Tax=Anguilla anguilla TaxID=7936 RepID=A0A0E9R065_ANGAN